MSSTEELHQLIHSLAPREKRYFKLFAQFTAQKAENHYTHLFDLLNKMPVFDEKKLRKKLANASFIDHLHSTVYHLFNLLLKSLKSYHAGKTELSKLREDLASARILYNKGLFPACTRLLARCRKKAIYLEAYSLLLVILELEKKLLFKSPNQKFEEEILHKLEQVKQTVRKMENESDFAYLRDLQLSRLKLQRKARDPDSPKEDQSLMANYLLKSPEQAKTFRAKLYYHEIHGHYALENRKLDDAFEHFEKNVRLWDEHPQLGKQNPELYLPDLINMLNAAIYSKRLSVAGEAIEKMRAIPVGNIAHEVTLLNQSYYAQLIYALNSGNFEGGEELVANIEKLIDNQGDQLNFGRIITYYYNITNFFFVKAEYRSALKWLNKIINFPKSDQMKHLQDFARIFQIILHFELGNEDLVDYLFRSAYRYYRRKQQLFEFEEIIFNFLRRMMREWQPRRQLLLFRELYAELWDHAKALTGRPPAGLYEVIFWLQSKMERKSLADVFQERVIERWKSVAENREEKLD